MLELCALHWTQECHGVTADPGLGAAIRLLLAKPNTSRRASTPKWNF